MQINNGFFVGIDPSLTATGLVIIDNFGKLLHSKIISSKLSGPARLAHIRDSVYNELSEFLTKPSLICIEHYAMGCKFGREAAGELGGVLRVLFYENECEYLEIPPLRLKQYATGKATAEKDHILMAVYKKWGVEFAKNDEADAFILAQMARAITIFKNKIYDNDELEMNFLAYEREVIENILNPVKKSKKKRGVA